MTAPTPRRAVLVAALAVAATATAATAGGSSASAASIPATPRGPRRTVDNRFWFSYAHWAAGTHRGTAATAGPRPGLRFATPAGRSEYADPHTGRRSTWEYATWTSPVHRSAVPATEAVASWNARTPAGTWIQIELRGTYDDGTTTPWYVMGRWASGEDDIRRTSVDGQTDGRSSVRTDTLAVDAPGGGPRFTAWQLRLTLYRKPGALLGPGAGGVPGVGGAPGTGGAPGADRVPGADGAPGADRVPGADRGPTVWLAGAMTSDIPDRFTVPASAPSGPARELRVPRYSQEVHTGRYPQYDNGGEAWCSPTSSQMVIEYWGHRTDPAATAWVDPRYSDPQVCHAARSTYDAAYKGCGNWPFNAAYAATHPGLAGVVTRLTSLTDLETLVRAGIPVITTQSFRAEELTGAGYGTAGHLMTVTGFTAAGDVVANDPHSPDNPSVRRVYARREFETVWLRTRRHNAAGKVVSGAGGVCYLYVPVLPDPARIAALRAVGVLGNQPVHL